MESPCTLCGRPVPKLTLHHLIPKSQHARLIKRTGADKHELSTRTIDVCPPCHKMIHKTLTEKELATDYNTLDQLRQHPELQSFIQWVRKQPPGKKIKIR